MERPWSGLHNVLGKRSTFHMSAVCSQGPLISSQVPKRPPPNVEKARNQYDAKLLAALEAVGDY